MHIDSLLPVRAKPQQHSVSLSSVMHLFFCIHECLCVSQQAPPTTLAGVSRSLEELKMKVLAITEALEEVNRGPQ